MPDIARRRVISASPSSPGFQNSPPFEELGCFDEESCRYFLREVGARVVPFYPFNFGMEEVYSLILEKFGYPGIPDATSVLQELLENEGVAGGFGDDGDIWRSWRHSWRHRNDDSLNPFIPKIGNFILQAPTEPHIRRIKAQNFIRKCEKANAEGQASTSAVQSANQDHQEATQANPDMSIETGDEEAYLLPTTTFSHQRTRTLLASGISLTSDAYAGPERLSSKSNSTPSEPSDVSVTPNPSGEPERPSSRRNSSSSGASSQQEFIEVDPSNLDPDIDPSLLISFEMLTTDPTSPSGYGPSMRGGQAEVITLQQVASSSRPTTTGARDDDDAVDQANPSRDKSGTAVLASGEAKPPASEQLLNDIDDGAACSSDATTAEKEKSNPPEHGQSDSEDEDGGLAEQGRSSARAAGG